MKKTEKVNQFIANNDDSTIKDYHDKLFENLTVLNKKEDKLILWQIIITFLYLFASNIKVNNFELGPISIKDTLLVAKALPLVFTYVLYDLHSVSYQKKDLLLAFNIISKNRFDKNYKEEERNTYLIRIFRPYTFSSSITELVREKPGFIEVIIAAIVIFPIFIIGILPYVITISMLFDLYTNHMDDLLGRISFFCSLWLTVVVTYQFIVKIIEYRESD